MIPVPFTHVGRDLFCYPLGSKISVPVDEMLAVESVGLVVGYFSD